MSWGSDGTCCRGALKLQPRGWDAHGPLDSATAMMATGPLLLGGYPFSLTWSFFFFKFYLFIYGCVGSSFLCEGFL